MLERTRWPPLPMPQDVIDRVAVLARQNPVGMNFTNMRNEATYDLDDDNDSDSDDDSDYDSDDDNDEDDDDDYDDFIAGVDVPNNADLPDPPDENDNENVDEYQQNDDEEENDEGDDDGNLEQEQAEAEEPIEEPIIPASLRKLAGTTGAPHPMQQSRNRGTDAYTHAPMT